jgi:hypothetical protein
LYKANIDEPPYIFSPYPPLYPFLVSIIHTIVKIPLFQAGRVVSLFFSLVSGAVIGLLSWRITENKLLGALAAILFWGHPFVWFWSSLARVDLMALGFSLLGLWILFQHWNSSAWISLACLCFLASAFTRQTYILAGPLAGFVWLWHHNPRRGLAFATLFVCSGLLIFGLINTMTNGGFYNNIVFANISQYDFSRTFMISRQLLVIWPLLLLACLLAILFTIQAQFSKRKNIQDTNDRRPFIFYGLVFYTLGAFLSALTVGKAGSNVNYFLELIAVGAIWSVIAIQYVFEQKKAFKIVFMGLLFIQLIWVLAVGYQGNRIIMGTRWSLIAFYESLFKQVQLATKQGIVLSDNYLDLVVLSGQPIYFEPVLYTQLYKAGLWDITGLSNEIKEQKFPLILIGGQTMDDDNYWPPPLIESLRTNYSIEITPHIVIFIPSKYH